MKRNIVLLLVSTVLLGCGSSVVMQKGSASYVYSGEKYSSVELELKEPVDIDSDLIAQMRIEQELTRELRKRKLFDSKSKNKLKIVLHSFKLRRETCAMLAGIFAGTDNADGSVQLTRLNKEPVNFKISAFYGLGSFYAYDPVRLRWLGQEFAKATAETIARQALPEKEGKENSEKDEGSETTKSDEKKKQPKAAGKAKESTSKKTKNKKKKKR